MIVLEKIKNLRVFLILGLGLGTSQDTSLTTINFRFCISLNFSTKKNNNKARLLVLMATVS